MKIYRVKIMSRTVSRVDLFVESRTKFLHQKSGNLLTKTVVPALSCKVKLYFKPSSVHLIQSCIVCFGHLLVLVNRPQNNNKFVEFCPKLMILNILLVRLGVPLRRGGNLASGSSTYDLSAAFLFATDSSIVT